MPRTIFFINILLCSQGARPVDKHGHPKAITTPDFVMTHEASLRAFFSWLEECAHEIRRMEEQARRELQQQNTRGYYDGMRSKAELLAGLPKASIPLISPLPEDAAQTIQEGLWRFARNAGNALSLNSVFYMSALLYPETYQDGERNDLERFLEELRARFLLPQGTP